MVITVDVFPRVGEYLHFRREVQRRVCVLWLDKGKDCTEVMTTGDKWSLRIKSIYIGVKMCLRQEENYFKAKKKGSSTEIYALKNEWLVYACYCVWCHKLKRIVRA